MNILLVGTRTKLAVNYINFMVNKIQDNVFYFAIDDHDIDCEVSVNNKDFIFNKIELNKENINIILKKYNITHVINFYELKEASIDLYTKYNYELVVDLADCAFENNVLHLTHISTTDVYGDSKRIFKQETDRVVATCDYTESKINAELYLLEKAKVKSVVLRISEVYGLIFKDTFIDKMLLNIIEDEDILIDEDSDFIRSYIDVQDCIFFISNSSISLLTGVFNVCSNLHIPAKELIDEIRYGFGYENRVVYTNKKKVLIPNVRVECSAICQALNYTLTRQSSKWYFFVKNVGYANVIARKSHNKTKKLS